MGSSEVEKIFPAFAESRKAELPRFTPDGIPITPENKFDDGIYAFLYNYWKEHSREYDPKKDVIPESEMNKMHPKTKNEFQFEQWLFEQYGMTSKEKTENTLMGNLNVLLEVSDIIDIAALPVGAIAVGAKLVGKKVIKEVGEKAVKEVAKEAVEKTVKREVTEEAVEKTVKTEVSEEVAETTVKKEMVDTTEDLSQKTVIDKETNTFKNSSNITTNSRYSGDLVKVDSPDVAADALAKRIGGESRVKFSNDSNAREFDVVSDQYIAQAKPDLKGYGKSWRKQTKATFEAAKETGRIPYFQFEGEPSPEIIKKIQEYSERYGVDYVIDTKPLGIKN